MLLERRFRLLTPILAAKRSNNPAAPRRVFVRQRTPKNEPTDQVYLSSDLRRWEWAFLEARDVLNFEEVCLGAILPSHWYGAKHTATYNRKFRRGTELASEQFESIPAGHLIRMRFTLSRHIPPNTDGMGRFTRPPDEAEFDAMLSYIGEYLGMSEWGHALKMGRFELKLNNAENDGPITQETSIPGGSPDSSEELYDSEG